jgi:TonB dependent receptor/TonB-dependent Receptor Plug Domain
MIFALATLVVADPAASEVVIVRAERLRAPAAQNQGVRLSGEVLVAQSGVRLDEALRVVPGIGLFRRTPSGSANATIQGLSLRPIAPNGAGRALVTLDGVPQNDPFGGWIYWGRYDPAFLASVEVRRGGAGAGFGPLALAGVLDLTEARGDASLGALSGGSFGALHGALRQSLKTDGAVFTAMAAYDVTDGDYALKPAHRGLVDRPLNSELMAATLVTDIARTDATWSFRASGFREAKGAGVVGGGSVASGLDVSGAMRIERPWGQARLLVYAQGRDFSNQAVAVSASRGVATPSLDQVATPSSALGGALVVAPLGLPALTIDWRRAEGETQELFRYVGAGFTRARIAGGQQDFVGLGLALPRPLMVGQSGIQLDASMRLDYWANSRARRRESDRATGIVTLMESAPKADGTLASGQITARLGKVSLSAYRTFRPPSLNELHRPFRVGNDITEANPNLRPETLTGLDLTTRHSRAFGGGTLSGEMTLYANRLYGPITNVTIATGPGTFARVGFLPVGGALRERRNVGHIDATGLEAGLGWYRTPSASSGQIGVSLTDARVDGGALLPQLGGKRPAQAPRWSAFSSVTWPVSPQAKVTVTARGEGTRFEDDLNSRRLPSYGALDLRFEHRWGDHFTMFISAENALNQLIPTARAGDGLVSYTGGRVVRLGISATR